jgi:hypothetical protein
MTELQRPQRRNGATQRNEAQRNEAQRNEFNLLCLIIIVTNIRVPLFLGNKPMGLKQSSGRKTLADWLKSREYAYTTNFP